jgi:fumarate reductase flavoprotein subunit
MSILDFTDQDFDYEVPVAIIGGGACGMTAALALRDLGVDCAIFEQDKIPAGSTAMSYGAICAAGSQIQREAGIDDCADDLYQDIMTITAGQTDPILARLLADTSGPAVDWLRDGHGINLTTETSWTGLGHRQPRLHAPPNRSGATLMSMLETACRAAGAEIVTEAQATNLYADAAGRVHGLRLKRRGGDFENVGARAIILASCGFGANAEWVQQYIPEMASARYFGHEGNRGDAIAWGVALGGQIADMGSYQALGSLAVPQMLVMPHTFLISGGVQVNTAGHRFQNELHDISGQTLKILAQPEGTCWVVYDERSHLEALSRFQEYVSAVEIGTPKIAQNVSALAEACKLPEEALAATLAAVESYCRGGDTDPYGRSFLIENILRPPFYAIRVSGALFHTQGGLCIDQSAAIIRQDGSALPNLFAGGGVCRSVSGPGGHAYLPGMGLLTAVGLGRRAGQSAAQVMTRGAPQ